MSPFPEPLIFPLQGLTISARAEITFPRVVKDLLMLAPSWKRTRNVENEALLSLSNPLPLPSHHSQSLRLGLQTTAHSPQHCPFPSLLSLLTFRRMPRAPEESARSLPARSTKLILLTWVRRKRQDVIGVSGVGQINQQNNQQGNRAVVKGWRKPGRKEGRRQEEMEFVNTTERGWLVIHCFIYLFIDIYMPTVYHDKGHNGIQALPLEV